MVKSALQAVFSFLSSHKKSQQSLWSHWRALIKWHMGCHTTLNIHLCLCYGLGLLWLFLSTTEQMAQLPVSSNSYNPSTTYGRNQKRKLFVIVLRTVLQYFVVKLQCVLCKITNRTTQNNKSYYTKLQIL